MWDIPGKHWWVNDIYGEERHQKSNFMAVRQASKYGVPLFDARGARRSKADVLFDIREAKKARGEFF